VAAEFEESVCVDKIVNWTRLQKALSHHPSKLNLVEEIVFAAGGKLMELAEERLFSLPWRIDATKTADEPIYSLELTGTRELLHPRVLLDLERHSELPLTVVLTDSKGRKAKLNVNPV
jgi:hypothetical protein